MLPMMTCGCACAGRQLLQTLEVGAPVRKKWVTRLSAAEAAAAAKTTRHVRCFVRGGKVCLRYLHQVRGECFPMLRCHNVISPNFLPLIPGICVC